MINFVVRYGISMILCSIIWCLAILSLDPMIGAVALVVTAALLKEKIDESKDQD
jgi:hypothetical protein